MAIWAALAKGLRAGDGGAHLITFHPGGGHSSGEWFHDADWLDFHLQQNGHNLDTPVWDRIAKDYTRPKPKPVLDGEPLYEDHPIAFKPAELGHSNAADVRKFLYGDLFSGACGHTYGNHAIWQFYTPERQPVNLPLTTWQVALQAPGAGQMQHARALFESRPQLTRVPAPEMVAGSPGAGGKRVLATRCSAGQYAFVYAPASRPFAVRLNVIKDAQVRAYWFDPRTGTATAVGTFATSDQPQTFTPPDAGENRDWVLVLDAVGAKFGVPGQR
jgi:hypothetical protein